MAILYILDTIIPMFVILFLGFFFQRQKFLPGDSVKTLNFFIKNVFFPALLFSAMAKQNIQTILNYPFISACIIVLVLTYVLAYFWFKITTKDSNMINNLRAFAASCPNTAYIGIPLLVSIFGKPGLIPAAISSILSIFLMAGTLVIIERERNTKLSLFTMLKQVFINIFKNPLVVGSFLGIIYSAIHIPWPSMLNQFTTMLGTATIACALLSIGMVLADKKLDHLKEVSIISVIKLIIMPLIALVFAKVFHLDTMYGISLVLLCGLPTAVISYTVSDGYNTYAQTSSAIILATTTLSIFTLIGLNIFMIVVYHVHGVSLF